MSSLLLKLYTEDSIKMSIHGFLFLFLMFIFKKN